MPAGLRSAVAEDARAVATYLAALSRGLLDEGQGLKLLSKSNGDETRH
jgi:hypothetical protein